MQIFFVNQVNNVFINSVFNRFFMPLDTVFCLPWSASIYNTVFFFFATYLFMLSLISLVLLNVSRLLTYFFVQDSEKVSEYECGFEPFDSSTRQPFDVHFYLVGLLFLIFDVELSLLFPVSIHIFETKWLVLTNTVAFLVILTVGLIYEWHLQIIEWPNAD